MVNHAFGKTKPDAYIDTKKINVCFQYSLFLNILLQNLNATIYIHIYK